MDFLVAKLQKNIRFLLQNERILCNFLKM